MFENIIRRSLDLVDAKLHPLCPGRQWQKKGDFCFILTTRGHKYSQNAGAECLQMNAHAQLANITSQQMQDDVSDIIGPNQILHEYWVTACYSETIIHCLIHEYVSNKKI